MDWNDLRFLLAVQRAGTMAAAARRLGVDPTTAARRIARLEASISVQLVRREGDGTLRLTPNGEQAAAHAEQMERHAVSIDGQLVADGGCVGTVRLTAVPIIANRVLLPAMTGLFDAHPLLTIELLPDSRDYSLTRREADLAIRLSRPKTGGTQVKARKIAELEYAVYASSALGERAARKLPWIGFDEAMAHLPQARWIARNVRGGAETMSPLRVRDGETALEAAATGLGKTYLPTVVGDADARLARLEIDSATRLAREIWLLGHAEIMNRDYVKAAVRWIDAVFT